MYRGHQKVLALLLLSSLFFAQEVRAQWFVSSGGNLSWLTKGNPHLKKPLRAAKLFPSVGVGYHYRFADRWALEASMYYSDLGNRSMGIDDQSIQNKSLHAVVLSPFLSYWWGDRLHVMAGPTAYYVFKDRYRGTLPDGSSFDLEWGNLRPFVWGYSYGVRYAISDRWAVRFFYRRDLSSAGTVSFISSGDVEGEEGYGYALHVCYYLTRDE